jgi:hypothetical protein
VIIAGGSGVTFGIRHLKELADLAAEQGTSVIQSVTFAWCVPNPENLKWFEDDIAECLQAFKQSSVQASIVLYVSRECAEETPSESNLAYDSRVQYHFGQRVCAKQLISDAMDKKDSSVGIYGKCKSESCKH